jgi:hypothetical protein
MSPLLGGELAGGGRPASGPEGVFVTDRAGVRGGAEERRCAVRGVLAAPGIGVEAEQRAKLERLTRYVSRPPVPIERLDLTAQGQVRYRLKTTYRVRSRREGRRLRGQHKANAHAMTFERLYPNGTAVRLDDRSAD